MNKIQYAIAELRERIQRLTIVVIATFLGYLAILCMVLFIVYQLIGAQSGTEEWALDPVQTNREFKPGQAVTVNLDTVLVYVPPFAIPLPGSVFMSALDSDLYPVAGKPEWSRPQVVDVQFRNVEGTPIPDIVLSAPIKICFKLTETQWQEHAVRPGSFAIQYYGLEKGQPVWSNLPVAKHPELLELCAQTDHLSVFALALKSEAKIPVTGSTARPNPTATPTQPSRPFFIDPGVNNRERINEQETAIALPPTSVLVSINTPRLAATNTSRPTANPTRTPRPTVTRPPSTAIKLATATRLAPTATRRATATRAPATATRRPTATRVPPTPIPPTAVPPTAVPATQPPPTQPPPTQPPPTQPPPTEPPPTEPPPTEPPPTEPPPTEPPPTEPPPTEPPPTEPPPTEPPPTEPPPTDPPPTEPPPTEPPATP